MLLSFAMVLSLAACSQSQTSEDGITQAQTAAPTESSSTQAQTTAPEADSSALSYSITDCEVTITDCNTLASGEMRIPSKIEGCPVTKIGQGSFEDCSGLTIVTIPDSVTDIGAYAFEGCTGLESVMIPDSVTSICASAFYKCSNLKDVYYNGTENRWSSINIDSDNECLIGATIHFGS